jgi:hypothetical protein
MELTIEGKNLSREGKFPLFIFSVFERGDFSGI